MIKISYDADKERRGILKGSLLLGGEVAGNRLALKATNKALTKAIGKEVAWWDKVKTPGSEWKGLYKDLVSKGTHTSPDMIYDTGNARVSFGGVTTTKDPRTGQVFSRNVTLGTDIKNPAPSVIAHEQGHLDNFMKYKGDLARAGEAIENRKLLDAVGQGIGRFSLLLPNDNAKLVGTGIGAAMALPALKEEFTASAKGWKMLKNIPQYRTAKGKLRALGSLGAGFSTYLTALSPLAVAAVNKVVSNKIKKRKAVKEQEN